MAACALLLLSTSCVGGRETTGPEYAELAVTLQPALVPSVADGSALPIHRIRTVVARQPDGVVLREQRFDVSPTAASWNVEVAVPVERDATEVIVYLLLIHVGSDGTEVVQFSGRTAPMSVSVGSRIEDVDADIVRGPLTNLAVTGVSIASAPDTLYVGASADLSATVTTSASTQAQVFWTSLDPTVLEVVDSTATGVAAGTAEVVASAGAHADTASVVVIVPAVDSMRVSPDSADVQVGQTRAYTVELFDASGGTLSGRPVTWTTGNSQIATVSATGVVSGVAPGTTTVRATSEGVFDEAVVRVTAVPTGGGTISWNATSGNWSDASKWSPNRVPAAGDTVVITQGGDYTVTLDTNATVARLVLGGTEDVIELAMSGATLTINGVVNGPELEILPLGGIAMETGSLLVDGITNAGYLLTNGFAIVDADSVRSTGRWGAQTGVQVLGSSTGVWFEANGQLEIGQASALTLAPGSELLYAPDGSATIEGTGLLSLGEGSTMTLFQGLVLDGPGLSLQGSSIIPNGVEDITIGPTSILQLTSEGAPVEIDAILDIQGALTAIGRDTRVGYLEVANGGSVYLSGSTADASFTAAGMQIGGDVSVTGLAMILDVGELMIQAGATLALLGGSDPLVVDGELTVQSGGTVLVASEMRLRRTDTSGADVSASHINNGTIEIIGTGHLRVQLGGTAPSITNNGSIELESSTSLLTIENLAAPGVGQIINSESGVLTGLGTVDVRTGIPGGTNDGQIAPGLFGTGLLTWMGSVPMGNTGTIAIELLTPAVYDQMSMSGDLLANGTLLVTAPGGLVAAPGDRFAVLTFRSRIGNFDTVTLPPLSGVALDTVWAEGGTQDTLYLVASAAAPAPVTSWINASGGSWSTASNWSGGAVPTSTDSVAIDLPGTYTVTLDVDATVRNLTIGGASGTQTLTATSRSLTIDGSSAVYANGQLTLANSTVAGGGTLRNFGSISLTDGAINAPLTNSGGQIGTTGTPSFNGSFRNLVGSTVTLGAQAGHTTLTVANGFTNEGTIELTNTTSAYNAALAVTNGTLVNEGTLAILPGLGGVRTLAAELDNQGTLTLDHPLTIDRANAAHVNSSSIGIATDDLTVTQSAAGSFTNTGAITIASGRTLTLTGGTVDLDQGTVSGAGTLSIAGTATYEFLTSTVTAPMLIAQPVTIPANVTVPSGQTLTLLDGSVIDEPIANQGTILIQGSVSLLGSFTMPTGSLLRVGALPGHSQLFFQSGFTNQGTIELTNSGSAYNARLGIVSGPLTNEGTIRILPGLGGQRFLSVELVNDGTLQIDHLLTIDAAFANHVNNTTIAVSNANLEVLQSTDASFTNFGAITVASGRTLTVAGGVLNLEEGTTSGAGTLVVGTGTELLFSTSTVTTPMQVFAGATIPNDVTVPSGETLSLLDGSVIDEPIDVQGGTVRTAGVVTFNGSLTTTGTIRVGAFAAHSLLTVADGFTNEGTIELTNTGSAYNATLAVTSGTLVNTGTLSILPGLGGSRTLAAELDNQGTLTVDHPLTIDRAGAAHVNNSTINLPTDDLTIVQSALGSFTNNSTISVGPSRTVTVMGGTLVLTQGAMSGSAARLSVGAGATFEFTTATVTIPMTIDATVTIPGDVAVPAGQILTLLDNTVIDEAISNSGTIIVAEDVTFNGSLSMETTGSVLRVGGLAGHAVLTVANGFTNVGTIELTSFGGGYNSTLDIVTGSLLNQGFITPLVGNGGLRTLDAALDNEGVMPMSYSMTVTGALNQLNVGNITLSVNGTTLTVGGLLTLNTGSSTIANPNTSVVLNGGCSDQGGNFSGFTCTP